MENKTLRIANCGIRIIRIRSILPAFLAVLLSAAACGGGSSANWGDLPEYLEGSVVIYGDSRTGHTMHQKLAEGMASLAPLAVLHTGDLVSDGRIADQWLTFNNIVSVFPSDTPYYPALGNHERESQLYFDNFELPGNERWYSAGDIDGFNFIVLDTESSLAPATSSAPASPQYQWLESELSSSISSTSYTIVTFHYPLYSTGQHGSDGKGIRDDLVPLFEQYGVDAVFNGHDHDYERFTVGGIRYVVTGGGGAPLRSQDSSHPDLGLSEKYVKAHHFCVLYFDAGGKLMVEAWSDKVQMIDRFEIINR